MIRHQIRNLDYFDPRTRESAILQVVRRIDHFNSHTCRGATLLVKQSSTVIRISIHALD